MFEGIVIGLGIALVLMGLYLWWIYRTARRYGKREMEDIKKNIIKL